MDIEQTIEQEFLLNSDIAYLNHAAVSPWPKRTAAAVKAFAKENLHEGSKHYLQWLKTEQHLREQMAQLINAEHADDIALLKNTSEALSVVAYGLDWSEGDNVVISDQEFPSNRVVWESLSSLGVEVRQINIRNTESELALINAFDNKTRLLSISSVQYADGFRVDLEQLGHACKQHDVLFCVDAIQSIGALQLNVQQIQADFVMADAHKWMLGPEGVALFYCAPHIRDRLKLNQYGWRMLDNPGEFSGKQWQVTKTARRFECGSPNMLGIHAVEQSLSLILELTIEQIQKRILQNTQSMIELVQDSPDLVLLSSEEQRRRSGIVTFKHQRINSDDLYGILMENNIICAARGGGVRFAPHFYTKFEQIRHAFDFISNLRC